MTPALRWLLVAAAQARPVFEVPKHRLDFSADTDAMLHSQCAEPERLPKAIRQHLYWYAMVSSEDPDLLRQFLDFYAGRGVRLAEKGRARLLLHPPLNMNMTTHRLTKNIVDDAFGSAIKKNVREVSDFSSEIKRDCANEYLKTLPKDALLMFPDLDEFFDAPSKDMERTLKKYGAVLGHMVDRVAEDWALRKTTNRPLWLQYPRRCAATAERFHGANTKWMLVPQSIRFATAHHIQSEIRVPPSLPFSHYRFTERSLTLLKKKRDLYRQRGISRNRTEGRAHIYDVVLSNIYGGALSNTFRKKIRCGTTCNT